MDIRLICTFCDVLIKLGRSPLVTSIANATEFPFFFVQLVWFWEVAFYRQNKEDLSERGTKKLSLPAQHSLLTSFLNICIVCRCTFLFSREICQLQVSCLAGFTDETGTGQTQMLGKIAEALFAVSDDPNATLRTLVHFVLMVKATFFISSILMANGNILLYYFNFVLKTRNDF